eukprot:3409724-Amphidinium_carterae.2
MVAEPQHQTRGNRSSSAEQLEMVLQPRFPRGTDTTVLQALLKSRHVGFEAVSLAESRLGGF